MNFTKLQKPKGNSQCPADPPWTEARVRGGTGHPRTRTNEAGDKGGRREDVKQGSRAERVQ